MNRGFLYAATGDLYVTLARRSARALRLVHPDVEIDLFTDASLEDPVFSRVIPLHRVSRRPKIEALNRSRFQHTIYMDADTATIAPIDDIFDLLQHFDMALCSEARRNDARNRIQIPGAEVPVCFPQLNSGVIGLRKSAEASAVLADWDNWVHNREQMHDQPSLRALLYRAPLRLHVLPPEYNVMFFSQFMRAKNGLSAPRVIHQPRLHDNPPGDPLLPLEVKDLLGQEHLDQLATLLSQDKSLARYVDVKEGRPGSLLPRGTNPNPRVPIGGNAQTGLRGILFRIRTARFGARVYRKVRRLCRL